MTEALLVLAGAIVGGAMSALGSAWSTKKQLIRQTRVEIFRELLPTVYEDGPDQPLPLSDPGARWHDVFRAAESLGGKDWRHGAELRYVVNDWDQYLFHAYPDGDEFPDTEALAKADRQRIIVRRKLTDYETWLWRRLAGLRRGPQPVLR